MGLLRSHASCRTTLRRRGSDFGAHGAALRALARSCLLNILASRLATKMSSTSWTRSTFTAIWVRWLLLCCVGSLNRGHSADCLGDAFKEIGNTYDLYIMWDHDYCTTDVNIIKVNPTAILNLCTPTHKTDTLYRKFSHPILRIGSKVGYSV